VVEELQEMQEHLLPVKMEQHAEKHHLKQRSPLKNRVEYAVYV
jgi:hypothetical protein